MAPSSKGFSWFLGAAIIGAGLCASAADAADLPSAMPVKAARPAVPEPWKAEITPYAWLSSLNGSSTVKGHTTDIDATFFGDLIHRKIPKGFFDLVTSFETRNDRLAVIGDFTYLLLGVDKGESRSATFGERIHTGTDAALDIFFDSATTRRRLFEGEGSSLTDVG